MVTTFCIVSISFPLGKWKEIRTLHQYILKIKVISPMLLLSMHLPDIGYKTEVKVAMEIILNQEVFTNTFI